MRPLPAIPALLVALVLGAALVLQHQRLQRLNSDLTRLRMELGDRPLLEADPGESPAQPASRNLGLVSTADPSLQHRLIAVEEAVATLMEANEHLMSRGQIPLSSEKRNQLLAQLSDPTADERERLRALRLLRRGGGLDDDVVQQVVGWLNGSTNGGLQLRLLQQLAGLTNSALRDPLLALVSAGGNAEVQQRVIGALRPFMEDPQVEAQLWGLLQKDGAAGVRREVREALVEGPASEARVAALRLKASNPTATLDERSVAWEALRASGQTAPEVSASLAQLALTTTDSQERVRLFEAFNQASDPAFVPSLVQGLQDPSPLVRAKAADALSDFRSDPAIEEWYRYLVENDTDPTVRRQASRVLNPPTRGGGARERPPAARDRVRP